MGSFMSNIKKSNTFSSIKVQKLTNRRLHLEIAALSNRKQCSSVLEHTDNNNDVTTKRKRGVYSTLAFMHPDLILRDESQELHKQIKVKHIDPEPAANKLISPSIALKLENMRGSPSNSLPSKLKFRKNTFLINNIAGNKELNIVST